MFAASIMLECCNFQKKAEIQLGPRWPLDSGTLILTLGKDTTLFEQFTIRRDSIHSRIISLPGGLKVSDGNGILSKEGMLLSMATKVSTLSPAGTLQSDHESNLISGPDSTTVVFNKNGQTTVTHLPGNCYVINEADNTGFYLFPYWGFYEPATVGDSLKGNHLAFKGARVYTIKRTGKYNLRVGSNLEGYLTLAVDSAGRLDSINGIGSSLNIMGMVYRGLNFDSLVTARIHHQQKYGILPPATTKDSVLFRNGKLRMTVRYWSPSVRDRKIFGAVVPFNRVWRTGANAATEMIVNRPVQIYAQTLERGRYSIFTIPQPDLWIMIINRQADIWGTDYDSTYDVMRIPMKVDSLPDMVEKLKLNVVPFDSGGIFTIEWEKTRAAMMFKPATP